MLQPKKTKFRKQMKGRNNGFASAGSSVSFGDFALKATTHGMLTSRQIEAARRALVRYIKRGGKVWIRVFPDKPITKNHLKQDKAKAKATLNIGQAQSSLGKLSMRLQVLVKKMQEEHLSWRQQSFLWQPHL